MNNLRNCSACGIVPGICGNVEMKFKYDLQVKSIMFKCKNKTLISRFGFNVSNGSFPKKHNSLRSNTCFLTEISPGNIKNPTLNHSLFLFLLLNCIS